MEARGLSVTEKVSASRKLGADDARGLVAKAKRVIVSRGKKRNDYRTGSTDAETIVAEMLGSTGNLRAPLLKVGTTLLVGFHEEAFGEVLG